MLNATEKAKRSDSLYYDNVSRRQLCNMVANLEGELDTFYDRAIKEMLPAYRSWRAKEAAYDEAIDSHGIDSFQALAKAKTETAAYRRLYCKIETACELFGKTYGEIIDDVKEACGE